MPRAHAGGRATTSSSSGARGHRGRAQGRRARGRRGAGGHATAPRPTSTGSIPKEWKEATDESDYDLIALTLDRMEAAVGAAEYKQAEQARLEAYAFFEFGPERRLKAFDPGLAIEVEGLIWFGAARPGGARRADRQARGAPRGPRDAPRARRRAGRRRGHAGRQRQQGDGRHQLGRSSSSARAWRRCSSSPPSPRRSSARERRLRRPGASSARCRACVVSGLTWVLAQTLLQSLDQYGEKLEAVVGLVAIGVLLLDHQLVLPQRLLERVDRASSTASASGWRSSTKTGFISAQALGLLVLGLTSVYREGFETVLFLQSLELSARARRRCSRAPALGLRADVRRRRRDVHASSASCPTRRCWSSPA